MPGKASAASSFTKRRHEHVQPRHGRFERPRAVEANSTTPCSARKRNGRRQGPARAMAASGARVHGHDADRRPGRARHGNGGDDRLQLRQPGRGRRLARGAASRPAARRSRIRPAIARMRSASSTSPICAIPTATSCADSTDPRSDHGNRHREQVARRPAAGRHAMRRRRPATDMTFSIFLPPQAEAGAKLPVLWYLSGLTCTHANVTEKGEYRAACAEHRHDLRRAGHQPARRRTCRTIPTALWISARARASTSMRPRSRGPRNYRMWTLCHRGAAGADRGRISRSTWTGRRSPAIRWAAMAR